MRRVPALGVALTLALLAALAPPAGAQKAPDPCGKGSGGRAVAYRGDKIVKVKDAPDACLYHTGFFAAEPTLGITEDGSIFVVALDAARWPLGSTTIRSQDGGLTWEDVTPSAAGAPLHTYSPWGVFSDGCFEGRCDHIVLLGGLGEAIVGRLVGGPDLGRGWQRPPVS